MDAGSAPDAPASPTPAPLAPVAPRERILTLDVLRGIALFGVLAANIWVWFSGIVFRFPEYHAEIWSLDADALAFLFIAFFISGKALTTFSFLFGLGFAIQMMRAETIGRSIVRHHARRLAVLLLFGAIHAVFLWYGDILTAYAVLGFVLLLFRKRRERTILVWAAVLIVALPVLFSSIPLALSAADPAEGPTPAEQLAERTEHNAEVLGHFASAEPARIVRGNLLLLREMWLSPKAIFMMSLLGVFLLGLYAGRRRIFEEPRAHRRLLRGLVVYGFPIGIVATAALTMLGSIPPEQAMALAWMPLATATTYVVGTIPFALAYIAAATLLLEQSAWRGFLSRFAPVGRMALTNYLAQTVICVSIYYGGGLVGEAGPLLGLILAVIVFSVQMAWSAWWLARFRFGPMEWLWRSLTYGRMQPMRLAPAAPPATEAVPG